MSKKIIIATFGFVFVMCVAAQVVAVNNMDTHKKLETTMRDSFRA